MAELHFYYPSSPSDKRKKASKSGKYISYKGKGMKSRRARRPLLLRRPLPAGSYSSAARCPPALAPPLVLGGNFPTSVAARKSITTWSHFSMESSSETFTCRHLPALQFLQTVHRVSNILIQTTQLLARGNNNSSIDYRRRHVSVLVSVVTSDSEWRVTQEWRSIKVFPHNSLYIN